MGAVTSWWRFREDDLRARRSARFGLAIAALALLSTACDRIPPGGLFGPGTVDPAAFHARRMEYLEFATASVAAGSPLNAIAHMEREARDPGYVAPVGAFGPNAWDAMFEKMSTFADTSDFDALYLINADGSGIERVTWAESFASFPMFSRDGRHLVFCSTRNAATREINVFIADWVG